MSKLCTFRRPVRSIMLSFSFTMTTVKSLTGDNMEVKHISKSRQNFSVQYTSVSLHVRHYACYKVSICDLQTYLLHCPRQLPSKASCYPCRKHVLCFTPPSQQTRWRPEDETVAAGGQTRAADCKIQTPKLKIVVRFAQCKRVAGRKAWLADYNLSM